MTKTVIEKQTLTQDAFTLKELLDDAESLSDIDLTTVYVETEDGTQFGSVKLVEETLTDGSKVYNLVLSVAA
jgi:nitrate reductase assembly molybdenum cofactor insertion protein NarJ